MNPWGHSNKPDESPLEVREEEETDIYILAHSTHEGESEEPWLVSYADLMTLLFGFFAMLFTFTTFDSERARVEIDTNIAKHFEVSMKSMEKVSSDLRKEMKRLDAGKNIQLTLVEEGKGLEIAFDNAVLFAPGSAQLLPAAKKPLLELLSVLKSSGKQFIIRVEGHTDDNPISNNALFPTNWELSASRASIIVRLFESNGFPPDELTAVGYGSARPFLPNRDAKGVPIPENQSKNRRVLVKVALNLDKMLKDSRKELPQIQVDLGKGRTPAPEPAPAETVPEAPEAAPIENPEPQAIPAQ